MFAFAAWDQVNRRLHLVRDHLGIKPLYYSARGLIRFASTLKALPAAGKQLPPIDLASVASYLRFGYVPAPFTIFRDVWKVAPGEIVSISADGAIQRQTYWSLPDVARDGLVRPFQGNEDEAVEALDALLLDSITGQMISDVPIGAFLSGGIELVDSGSNHDCCQSRTRSHIYRRLSGDRLR